MSRFHEPNDLMREGDQGDPDAQQAAALVAGLARPEGLPQADAFEGAEAGGSRGLSHGTLLILAVAIVAAGTLYLMRATQGDLGSGADARSIEAKIEQALVKLTSPQALAPSDALQPANMSLLFRDTDSLVNRFHEDHSRRQVPVEFLKKDPFADPLLRPVVADVPLADAGQQALARKLAEELRGLRLDTVMQGARPVAIINGQLVQPGQSVGSFTVTGITGLSVELQAMGQSFTLAMQVNEDPAKGPVRRR